MTKTRLLVAIVIAALIAAFFVFDLGQYFDLAYLKSRQHAIAEYYAVHPLQTAAIFFLVYVAVTALSVPGASILTIAAGAIFGLPVGLLIASFASSIGATLAFLTSRFLLREAVMARFGEQLATINAGIAKDGAFYLFTLRLLPAFPFVVINLLMGLTSIRTRTFYSVSQIGMLLGTTVYVNAGTQLAQLDSLRGILSPGLIFSFVLLAIFPLLAKRAVHSFKSRKVLQRWPKPRRFDRNLIVIGAGSAGLVAAYIGAAVKARVTLIEKRRMGGDCLYTGCVPSKALIRSAKLLSHIRRANEFGIRRADADFEFADVMERVQRVVRSIEPHDSVERYTRLGVECISGEATITSPYSVSINGQTLTTRAIVIAAGASPAVPFIPGLEEVGYFTSETLWDLRTLPHRLVVLGGGPVGSELVQCFARFGSKVTQVEMLPRLLIREDPGISELT